MRVVGKQTGVTHGMSSTRLYRIYKHMKRRCSDKNDIRYYAYGARGIKVCDEWDKFEPFCEWALNNGYSDDLTIDRINVDGNYSPSNCRWITPKEQASNKRTAQLYEYNGEIHCIAEWANIVNMNYKKLWKRLKNGWNIEKALLTA